MKSLNVINSHFTASQPVSHENLLEKYRSMSNLDIKFLNKIYYGDHELEMR